MSEQRASERTMITATLRRRQRLFVDVARSRLVPSYFLTREATEPSYFLPKERVRDEPTRDLGPRRPFRSTDPINIIKETGS